MHPNTNTVRENMKSAYQNARIDAPLEQWLKKNLDGCSPSLLVPQASIGYNRTAFTQGLANIKAMQQISILRPHVA